MRATEGFTSVKLDIETLGELDVLLSALNEYAERRRAIAVISLADAAKPMAAADAADDLRLKIGEAAGL